MVSGKLAVAAARSSCLLFTLQQVVAVAGDQQLLIDAKQLEGALLLYVCLVTANNTVFGCLKPSITTEPGTTVFRSGLGCQGQTANKGRTAYARGACRQFSHKLTWFIMHGRAGQ